MKSVYQNCLFGEKTIDVINGEVCDIAFKFVRALYLQKSQPMNVQLTTSYHTIAIIFKHLEKLTKFNLSLKIK